MIITCLFNRIPAWFVAEMAEGGSDPERAERSGRIKDRDVRLSRSAVFLTVLASLCDVYRRSAMCAIAASQPISNRYRTSPERRA